MPTYEYVCTECANEFDAFQSITADPLTECPKCKGKVKRKISAGLSPIFKGSGFYQTDYKKSSTGTGSTIAKKDSSSSESSASSSSESATTK
ncbi:MAG: zinc ribbon domain-containing protein [Ignavibacteria bacterium]|nr:zinc ribbon domain-containing protein [Ignavibacteria bacterium]